MISTAPCNDVDPRGLALGPAAFDASLSLQAGLQNKHYPFLIGSGPTSLQDAEERTSSSLNPSVIHCSALSGSYVFANSSASCRVIPDIKSARASSTHLLICCPYSSLVNPGSSSPGGTTLPRTPFSLSLRSMYSTSWSEVMAFSSTRSQIHDLRPVGSPSK